MPSVSRTNAAATAPLACIPDAIPADERRAHFERAKRLFGVEARERQVLASGYSFCFDAGVLDELTRWMTHERRCCPFLSFRLEVEPDEGPLWIRLTGPEGTHDFLDAELPAPAGAPAR